MGKPFFESFTGKLARKLLTTTKAGRVVDEVLIGGLINKIAKEKENSPAGVLPTKKDSIRPIITVLFWVSVGVDMFVDYPLLTTVIDFIIANPDLLIDPTEIPSESDTLNIILE